MWRVFDRAIDWFVLTGGDYRPLEPGAGGVIHSQAFPGLRLAVNAMVDRDLAAVLSVQRS